MLIRHRTIFVFLFARALAVVAIALGALLVPVIFGLMIYFLPGGEGPAGLAMPILAGIAPTAFVLAAPLAVAFGTVWLYGQLVRDGLIPILFAARLSPLQVCVPALAAAALFAIAGLTVASTLAPQSATVIHDVLYSIRNSLDPRLLQDGRFHELDEGRTVLFFREWRGADRVEGVFAHMVGTDGGASTITARFATFEVVADRRMMILFDGRVVSADSPVRGLQAGAFERMVLPLSLGRPDTPLHRPWRGMFELPLREFFEAGARLDGSPRLAGDWASEAVKRFGLPTTAFSHTLLGLAVVVVLGPAIARRRFGPHLVAFLFLPAHLALLIAMEGLVPANPAVAWAIAAVIALEAALAAALLARGRGTVLRPPQLDSSANLSSSSVPSP